MNKQDIRERYYKIRAIVYVIIASLLLISIYSCDNIKKCRPKVNIKKGYVGFACSGTF